MKNTRIPDETIRRLPLYLRGMQFFAEQRLMNVSSEKLADFLHISAALIRKDFCYFGDFGTRGVGYDVQTLLKQIREILKLNTPRKAILVGAGNLGTALLTYPGFSVYGFEIVAAYDSDQKKIGSTINNVPICDIRKLGKLKKDDIGLAIIAVPAEVAQDVADLIIKAGIRGILNFAPVYLSVPKRVKVISIDIAIELGRLPYYLENQ
ncbi:MAG: redox-sensing transcriptional repressor Rex [Planctomycetes bacterium GWC2_49_10]|nr:MAG: redox-sensing transcriptional repressor Rex [Planctomycetes bacterium GWC2_49_10]